jgi:hypothetical protein
MRTLLDFLERHWLSLVLLLGAAAAVWFIYKNRDRLLRRPS